MHATGAWPVPRGPGQSSLCVAGTQCEDSQDGWPEEDSAPAERGRRFRSGLHQETQNHVISTRESPNYPNCLSAVCLQPAQYVGMLVKIWWFLWFLWILWCIYCIWCIFNICIYIYFIYIIFNIFIYFFYFLFLFLICIYIFIYIYISCIYKKNHMLI